MTAPVQQCQPDNAGHSEALGHAASLLQQAIWIEESVDGTAPPSQRLDLGDVDIDELRSAAQFIVQQAAQVEGLRKALEPFVKHYDEWMERLPDDAQMYVFPRHTMGELRAARSALSLEDRK